MMNSFIYVMEFGMKRNSGRNVRMIFGIVIPLTWIAALFFPAYSDGTPGLLCFIMGWTMLFSGNLFAFGAWVSNLPFWISFFLLMFGRRSGAYNAALFLAAFALMLSLGAFSVTEVMQNEAGLVMAVHPSLSVYVWLSANILLTTGAVIIRKKTAD
jgi:hypothetical protein